MNSCVVDAFTDTVFKDNLAEVVILDELLDETTIQKIAIDTRNLA